MYKTPVEVHVAAATSPDGVISGDLDHVVFACVEQSGWC